jgi:hypothetical protein
MVEPYRFSADLTKLEHDSFLIIKLGFYWHTWRGMWDFWRYTRLIAKSTSGASEWGLYETEYFLYDAKHAGLIQYWRSFDDLEAWACKNPEHTRWWKEVESENKWRHLSIYHEVYLIDRSQVETVYNLGGKNPKQKHPLPGMASFLPSKEPTHPRARKRFVASQGS